MEFKLNEQQQLCQDIAKEFAEKVIRGHIEEVEENNKLPDGLYDKMRKAGLTGIPFAEEYGGMGLGHDCFVLAIEQLSMVHASTPISIIVSTMFMQAVNLFGSEEQKLRYIPECIDGESIGSFAFTEPGTGSDPKQLTTTYRDMGDHFLISGTKRFISNASYPGPIVVFANDAESGATTGFIFDKFCEGYSLSSPWKTVGGHGSPIYDVFLDSVKVPKENVLYRIGGGFTVLKGLIAYSKMALSANFVGILGNAYNLAVKYAKEKTHRKQPIAKFPTIQATIARIAGMYYSCRLLVYHLAEHANNPADPAAFAAESAMVKAHVSDTVAEAARLCMTVLGAYGLCEEYGVARCVRDALQAPLVEGVSDIQRVIFSGHTLFE